eukprot:scaffold28118_cov70-Phaeocystis_antarctica.AAC.11
MCRVRQCGWSHSAYFMTPKPHTRQIGQPPWTRVASSGGTCLARSPRGAMYASIYALHRARSAARRARGRTAPHAQAHTPSPQTCCRGAWSLVSFPHR